MSTESLPPPLKIPEVSRFLNRANQLRTVKPAIAYWCEYHAVNQIVTKGLHTTDDDCFTITKTLLERLEATKVERADDDAVVDNTAGQAYVEQFAQETFERAERAMRANKVTRQTADTFDAAATFFDITHEWGTPEPEVLKKIKFAKWNAARILKAIRDGRDPNQSNPKVEEDAGSLASVADPVFREITSPVGTQSAVTTTEGASDAAESRAPPPAQGYFPPASASANIFAASPLSQGFGPSASGEALPPAPMSPASSPDVHIPLQSSTQIAEKVPRQVTPPPPEPSWTTPAAATSQPAHIPERQAASQVPALPAEFTPSHKNIEQAQKHAKWAISALNFDDTPTAVQELRNALAMLGAL